MIQSISQSFAPRHRAFVVEQRVAESKAGSPPTWQKASSYDEVIAELRETFVVYHGVRKTFDAGDDGSAESGRPQGHHRSPYTLTLDQNEISFYHPVARSSEAGDDGVNRDLMRRQMLDAYDPDRARRPTPKIILYV